MQKIISRICGFLCVSTLLFSMICMIQMPIFAAEDGLNLANMQIVVPAAATAVEETAADELQTYIYKITGIKPAIKTEGQQSGDCIYVGATKQAEQKGIAYPTEGDEKGEAWVIQAVNNELFLCGAPTRGPLYAVYHLLEDVLGVRWWNIWEEDVPKGDAIVPWDYCDSGVPVMEYREIYVGNPSNTDYAFFVRNRMNGCQISIPTFYGGREEYGFVQVHTFNRYFDAVDHSIHPEWFSEIDGQRVADGQLCLTNSELKNEFIRRLLREVEKKPQGIYSISPGDNTRFCQCAGCTEEINTYGMSGYVLRFVNEMADAVMAAGYTDATVEMLVYWVYLEPPKGGIVPASNVQIRYADNYTDLLHSLKHENNAESMKWLQAWVDICSNDIYYWQYVVVYQANGIFPSMFHYGEDITVLQELGVNGWFAEQEQCINVDFWDMKLWLLAKLMENPVSGEEYTALMDEFIYGYYGEEAGQHIREYLYYMHEKAEANQSHYNFGTNIIGAEWLDVQDILKGNEYFEKAFAAADGDATVLRRLRAARCGLDRVIHDNYGKWKQQAADDSLTLPFTKRELGERIYQTMTEQIAIRGSYDIDYSKFYQSYERRYSKRMVALPDQFDGVVIQHILDYTADDFRLAYDYIVVEDSDSQLGKAVCCNSQTRLEAGSNSLILSGGNVISVAAYDPDSLGGSEHYSIGEITANSIEANSGYQFYSLRWRVPALGDNAYIYMVNDWGVQNPFMAQELQDMAGQTVEIHISMKVEGVIDGSDPDNYPVYYIDRVLIVPEKENWDHHFEAYTGTVDGAVCKTACTICGEVMESIHVWDGGITVKAPTVNEPGEQKITCLSCGAVRTEVLDQLVKQSGLSGDHMVLLIVAGAMLNVAALGLLIVVVRKRQKA